MLLKELKTHVNQKQPWEKGLEETCVELGSSKPNIKRQLRKIKCGQAVRCY